LGVVNDLYLLGGHDLEMVTIRQLVAATLGDHAVVDRRLDWSKARASVLRPDIKAALAAGRQPVLVELVADVEPALAERCVWIDHHGAGAGADVPTPLEQVFRRLGLPAEAWTRELALVAANDRGARAALAAMGATAEEVRRIRAADRAAQGITAAEEAAAAAAVERAEPFAGGRALLVRLPHDRTAPVVDRLEPGRALVVAGPREINVFADGRTIEALRAAFPGGWWGGELPRAGFWGAARTDLSLDAVEAVMAEAASRPA